MFDYFLYFVVSYLFGSFPTAYLLIRIASKKDIRNEGSGNVGTFNAIRVSRKKWIGAVVLLIDLLKGALPAWYAGSISGKDDLIMLLVVCGVTLGHVYPVWLKFKGGRGLAVAAGALLMIEPVFVGIWLAIWLIFYIILRIHTIASMIATVALPVIVFFARNIFFSDQCLLILLPVCMLIFQRHLERLPDIVYEKSKQLMMENQR
ncbi:MAG: glycerol-3-phosphate 1-O-acyltransferase PlsY [Calditrichaceae bacterium]|nr:glycerol-3-phosphate 1-O-acyltransferase PlsY [Calditrichaceae bacterium]MBN2707452.1 glycerol-3-phosphate 1-O-acyltransferase PlsY [Calditrichaceae bacterium]